MSILTTASDFHKILKLTDIESVVIKWRDVRAVEGGGLENR